MLGEADYLLLHARAPTADPNDNFYIIGSALIPFSVLAEQQYLWESQEYSEFFAWFSERRSD